MVCLLSLALDGNHITIAAVSNNSKKGGRLLRLDLKGL
jgi:hypothetical protein